MKLLNRRGGCEACTVREIEKDLKDGESRITREEEDSRQRKIVSWRENGGDETENESIHLKFNKI